MENSQPIDDLILTLRKEFDLIKHDKAKKSAWFELHSSLSNDLLSQITGYSITWLYKIKYGCKTKPNKRKVPRPNIGRKIITIKVPEDWDNKDWLERQYKLLGGTPAIAKAVGVTVDTIRYKFKKYGIKTNSNKDISQNPCRNKEWIQEHYIRQDLNVKQCAALANVSAWTFKTWIMKYQIYKYPKTAAEVLRRKAGPEILGVKASKNNLLVTYVGRIQERYALSPSSTRIRKVDSYDIGVIPKLSPLNELDFDVNDTYLMKIDGDIDQLPYIGKRVAIHRLVNDLVMKIPLRLFHSRTILDNDLRNFLEYSNIIHTKYQKPVTIMTPRYRLAGRWLIEHFFDTTSEYGEYRMHTIVRSRKRLLRAATKLLECGKLNGLSLIRTVYNNVDKFIPPLFYVNLFKKAGVTGKVLDLYPYFGSKALACAALGIEYYTLQDPFFESGIIRGFCEFVGLKYKYYNGEQVDWVMSDYNLRANGIFAALPYKKCSKNLLVYVPDREYKATIQVGKPHHKLVVGTIGKGADYGDHSFLVW